MEKQDIGSRKLSAEQRRRLLQTGKKRVGQGIPRKERHSGDNIFPASFSQRRIWFIQQMQPESIEYNVPIAYIIKGIFCLKYCRQAFKEIIKRHEILRTTFKNEQGEPVQIVHEEGKIDFRWIDLTRMREGEEKALLVDREIKKVVNSYFDLEEGPLIKMIVVKEREEKHVLAIVAHHTIIDSWSLDILKNEFEILYHNFEDDKKRKELPKLDIQYGDYAVWQQSILNTSRIENQLEYWTEKVKNTLEKIELPLDFERPPIRTGKGAAYSFDLSIELTQQIKETAKEYKCTVFMVLLAAFQVLLYRYTYKRYITIGTTVSSRPTVETEQLIGFFINNLIFNTYIGDVPRFNDYLQRVKEETLENYRNQEVPFEKIVEHLHLKRDLSCTSVFQVMFNYLNASGETKKIVGLDSEMYPLGGSKATTDLNLFGWEEEGYIHFNFEYSIDLFKETTIERLSNHYKRLLVEILKEPTKKIDMINFLEKEEEEKYAPSKHELIVVDRGLTMHQLFEKQVEKTPHFVAAYCGQHQVTYVGLNQKANQLAHYLLKKGMKKGDRIGLYMDRSINGLIAMLGVLKMGGVYVPLDLTYSTERINQILVDGKVKHILTERYQIAKLSYLQDIEISFMDNLFRNNKLSTKNPEVTIDGEALMYILFTSGSTGQPKGVMVSHYNYISYINSFIERMAIDTPMSFAIVTTFAADLGSTNIYAPLLTGGCVHIVSYEKATNADKLAEYFKEHPIDVMKMVPSHFEALQTAQYPEWIIPRKIIIFAGEILTGDTVSKVWKQQPACKIFNNYGPTETTVSVLAYEVKHGDEKLKYIPLGKPLKNSYIYIWDNAKQMVPVGVEGELYIGGLGVTKGYLDRENLTRERFIESSYGRLYRTGDKARYKESADIEFLGRLDRQVKIRGYRVELAAIERVILEYPNVKEAIVCEDRENEGESHIIAYLTLKDPYKVTEIKHIKKYIKEKLTDYMVPTAITILDTLPLTSNGKIDVKLLPKPVIQLENREAYKAPRNNLEKEITTLWEEVLGIKGIGIEDNFFDLGGESFKAIRLVRKIGRDISIIDLFKYPTVKELCNRISGYTEQEQGRLLRLTPYVEKEMRMNYICLPFAGGSAITFQPLANEMPKDCAVYSIKLPGHDFTRKDDTGGTIESIIKECIQEIKDKVKGPISVYAQCVSGALGVALTYALRQEKMEVRVLFEAANFPTPRLPGKISEWWERIFPEDKWMSNKVYRETLRSLGNADDLIDDEEQEFIISGIRHDARVAKSYFSSTYYDTDLRKLDVPICCIIGERDRSTEYYEERYHEWEKYSEHVSLEVIDKAGHFFPKYQAQELCGILLEKGIRTSKNKEHLEKNSMQKPLKIVQGRKEVNIQQLSIKLFLMIMLGQVISLLGSNISSYAVGIWLYNKTGSIGDFSLIAVCALLPNILLAPIAGVVADRYDKRKIMIGGDLCAILGTCFVLIMYSLEKLEVWQLCIAIIISSIGSTFQSPAFLSAIPVLVPKYYLGQANGILQFAWASGSMLGPILGASALHLLSMKGVLLLDFITCFASVGILLMVRFPKRIFKTREEPFIRELIGGWHYIIKRHSLVVMVIFFVIANTLMSLITVVFTPLAIAISSPTQLGVVLAANAIGVVIGSIIMSIWGGTKKRADGMIGFLIMTACSIIIMGFRPSVLCVGIGLFTFGLSIAFVDTHWQIMIQSKVGLELQGRVFSINQMIVSIFRPIAMLLAAPLCENVFTPFIESTSKISSLVRTIIGNDSTRGMGLLLITTGGILLGWSLLGFNYKPLRKMEEYLPDAIPGAVIYEDKNKMQEIMDEAISS